MNSHISIKLTDNNKMEYLPMLVDDLKELKERTEEIKKEEERNA
jgi:hypothetical protein